MTADTGHKDSHRPAEQSSGEAKPSSDERANWVIERWRVAAWQRLRATRIVLRRLARQVSGIPIFSSLSHRIVVLNLFALVALLSGILYLNQFRAGLIDARVESLMTQAEIIAVAIASSNSSSPDQMNLDADELLKQDQDRLDAPSEDAPSGVDFSINPERIVPVLSRLISPTRTRARIFEKDASLLIDSRALYQRGDFLPGDEKPPKSAEPRAIDRIVEFMARIFTGIQYPIDPDSLSSTDYPEVADALAGSASSIVRRTIKGELIVSVAVPIQKNRAVLGALLLSTQGGDIDAIVRAERLAILRVFAAAASVTVILSIFLAGTIAVPLHRLAAAADRVRRSIRAREELPDYSSRGDEIGHLSSSIRDMTAALYSRLDAIENFAADVSHELKNPLTSLRSAVETLPLARTEASRDRLLEIIQHDVRRLDRLISDISDASRLDAELAREDGRPVDLIQLVRAVANIQQELARKKQQSIEVDVGPDPRGNHAYGVIGHDSRLGQVLTNLIDNARSFSPEHGKIRVAMRRDGGEVVVRVDDDGPGIRAEQMERVFERFYTDRPDGEGFGNNSGLGLAISDQIVSAHHGSIKAANRVSADGETVLGASFTVRLPAA
jgi:two-component system sensor histidine kinase ChvG